MTRLSKLFYVWTNARNESRKKGVNQENLLLLASFRFDISAHEKGLRLLGSARESDLGCSGELCKRELLLH